HAIAAARGPERQQRPRGLDRLPLLGFDPTALATALDRLAPRAVGTLAFLEEPCCCLHRRIVRGNSRSAETPGAEPRAVRKAHAPAAFPAAVGALFPEDELSPILDRTIDLLARGRARV